MAQSDSSSPQNVKMTLLHIVDFKKIQKQKINWNRQLEGIVDIISVKDFHGTY